MATNLSFKMDWGKAFGGSGSDMGWNIAGTSDGGYVAVGYSESNDRDVSGFHGGPKDAWILRVDAAGNRLWQRMIGGSGDENSTCALETPDGGILVAGVTNSTDGDFSANNGGIDVFLAKLDKSGKLLWTRTMGSAGDDGPSAIVADGTGSYLIAGKKDNDAWVFKVDGNGTITWDKKYGGSQTDVFSSIAKNTDGSFIVSGATNSNDGDVSGYRGGTGYDTWVVKIDNNGNKVWQKTFGGTGNDGVSNIVTTSDGGYMLAGRSLSTDGDMSGNHGGLDVFVLKLDKEGNKVWGKMIGGTGNETASLIVPASNGTFLLGIGTNSTSGDLTTPLGYQDSWILKIDEAGNDLGKQVIGGDGNDNIWALAKGADGSYAITGSTNSTTGDVVGYQGNIVHDLWLLKFRDQ